MKKSKRKNNLNTKEDCKVLKGQIATLFSRDKKLSYQDIKSNREATKKRDGNVYTINRKADFS